MFYVQEDCCLKTWSNGFGKSQDYNTTMPPQQKRQRAESLSKEIFDKKKLHLSNYALFTKVEYVCTGAVTNNYKKCFSNMFHA